MLTGIWPYKVRVKVLKEMRRCPSHKNLLTEFDGADDIVLIDATRDGRAAGTITLAPTEKESRGEVLLDEGVTVHVPLRVIEMAHHRPAFVMGAWIDISHRRERSGCVAVRINQIVKRKKRA